MSEPGSPPPRNLPRPTLLPALNPAVPYTDRQFRRLLDGIEGLSVGGQYAIAATLIALIFAGDVRTGPEVAFSIFYLLPIALVGWHRGARAAYLLVVVCGAAWLLADIAALHVYAHPAIRYWNALVRVGFFLIVAFTLTQLRRAMDSQQRLARTDSLTGVANSRWFLEIAGTEIARQRRYNHPISIAFIDCDNFKEVNDKLGHASGDDLLKRIAHCLQTATREVDIVARLGGDEFAMLMPETEAASAVHVCDKVRAALEAAVAQYAVTFSVGLVTYLEPPADVREMIHTADQAMYEAKKGGKNTFRQRVVGRLLPDGRNA